MNKEKNFFIKIQNVSLDLKYLNKEFLLINSIKSKSTDKDQKILNKVCRD
jgi:hypothetical protein